MNKKKILTLTTSLMLATLICAPFSAYASEVKVAMESEKGSMRIVVPYEDLDQTDTNEVPRLRASSIPESYLPADVTPVKDQGSEGLCWAYSATKSMELSTYMNTTVTKVFSALQFARAFWNHNVDQFNLTKNDYVVNNTKDNGSNDIYSVWASMKQITPNTQDNVMSATVHPVEARFINITDTDEIKKAIMENGAVTIAVENIQDNAYWYHETGGTDYDHAITLIGWSDKVLRSRFTENGQPTIDGAWRFVNSWGVDGFGETDNKGGYGWLSYDDPCMKDSTGNRALTYVMSNTWTADNVYQQDGGMIYATVPTSRAGNLFTAKGSTNYEKVTGAIVGISSRGNYKASVYQILTTKQPVTDGILLGTTEFNVDKPGYKTIYFDQNILVEHGDKFAVCITRNDGSKFNIFVDSASEAMSWIKFRPSSEEDSYYFEETQYSNANNCTPRIKVLTENLTASDETGTIDDYNVSLDYSKCVYTGEELYPTISITDMKGNKQNLSDFKFTYNNNINVGRFAEVVVRSIKPGITGTQRINFTIKPRPIDEVSYDSSYTTKVNYTYSSFLKNIKFVYNKKVLVYGQDFTCENPNELIKYGGNTIHVKGVHNYTSAIDITVVGTANGIAMKDLSVSNVDSKTFTGRPITLNKDEIHIKDGTTLLTYGEDYRLSYSDNTNVGTAKVRMIGLGSYTGISGDITTFIISPLSVYSTVISAPSELNYLNEPVKLIPNETIRVYAPDAVTLLSTQDYDLDYMDNDRIGTMTVYVKGKHNLSGTYPLDIDVVTANLKNAKISVDDVQYTGSPLEPPVTVTLDGVTLIEGQHYHTVYSNNTEAGTATVSVIGDGDIEGAKEATFKITKPRILAENVYVTPTMYYTGEPVTPLPQVVVNGTKLTLGTDYVLAYSNNVRIGTASVTLTGIRKWAGTVVKTFNIIADPTPKYVPFSNSITDVNSFVFPKNVYTVEPWFIPTSVKSDNKKVAKVRKDDTIKVNNKEGVAHITCKGVNDNEIVAYSLKVVKPKFKSKKMTVRTTDKLKLDQILTTYNIEPSKIKVSKTKVMNFNPDTWEITFNKKGSSTLKVWYGKYSTSIKFKVKDAGIVSQNNQKEIKK